MPVGGGIHAINKAVLEVLELTEAHRREDPDITEIYEDRIASTRRKLYDQLRKIGIECKLPRSHSTFEECRMKARHVFAGARMVRPSEGGQTVRPGDLTASIQGPGIFLIGDGGAAIDHQESDLETELFESTTAQIGSEISVEGSDGRTPVAPTSVESRILKQLPLGRPKKGGTFS